MQSNDNAELAQARRISDYPECPRHNYRVGVGLYQDYLQHVRVGVDAAASPGGAVKTRTAGAAGSPVYF